MSSSSTPLRQRLLEETLIKPFLATTLLLTSAGNPSFGNPALVGVRRKMLHNVDGVPGEEAVDFLVDECDDFPCPDQRVGVLRVGRLELVI